MRYTIHYAHADVRETGGELTEETPKGWGQVEIDVDHEIVSQADKDEVTKQIARSELREDGSPRYTHVAVQVITKKENEIIEVWSKDNTPRPLTAEDLEFHFDASHTFKGTPIGEDDYFVFYGHDITELEVLTDILNYVEAAEWPMYEEEEVSEYLFSRVMDRTYAKRIDDDLTNSEWIISWKNVGENDRGAFPVTVVNLQ